MLRGRGPSRVEGSGRNNIGHVTWIGTSRVLQFIREVIDGVASSSNRVSSRKEDASGTRQMSSGRGAAGGRSDASPQPSRRPPGRGGRQGGRAADGRLLVSGPRHGKDSSSRMDKSGKSHGSEGSRWGSRDHKVEQVSRGRSSGGGSEASSKPGSGEGRALNGWRSGRTGNGEQQHAAALPSRRANFRANDSSAGSRTSKPGKDALESKGSGYGRQRLSSRSDAMRTSREGSWGGRRRDSDAPEDGTTSSKKHKMRRPSMTYGKAGRKW
jgi:hypothetical protein